MRPPALECHPDSLQPVQDAALHPARSSIRAVNQAVVCHSTSPQSWIGLDRMTKCCTCADYFLDEQLLPCRLKGEIRVTRVFGSRHCRLCICFHNCYRSQTRTPGKVFTDRVSAFKLAGHTKNPRAMRRTTCLLCPFVSHDASNALALHMISLKARVVSSSMAIQLRLRRACSPVLDVRRRVRSLHLIIMILTS